MKDTAVNYVSGMPVSIETSPDDELSRLAGRAATVVAAVGCFVVLDVLEVGLRGVPACCLQPKVTFASLEGAP